MKTLLNTVRCVLFDFDGPLCDLFAIHPARDVAERIRQCVREHGESGLLGPELHTTDNAHDILRSVAGRRKGPFVAALERELTRQEVTAATSAWPTPFADRLVQTLRATGHKLAITTNNSPEAVGRYLETRGLGHVFGPRVYGRQPDVRLLKPDPDCLLRALDALGEPPHRAVMIGDAPVDVQAAQAAGVRFIGYGSTPAKAAALRKALGYAADAPVISSLESVLEVVQQPSR
ncbi:HAD family hydrolase [Streptomyces sp. 549]|uniref:HAD family hydrolase n=1 Tax=Streptomyces sp. 549 TaxID=3049076 RepID=UPI0024C26E95|nr:HAD family hydrolase [Streptomyces sp. 549]MDK1476194.1 HAD family hydrolase [Streptomyces sp. 549]